MSQQTNFQCVKDFHELFDHPNFTELNTEIFTQTPNLVDLRVKLIEEELNELKDALKNKDFVETADALSDLLYVIYGAGHVFGINLDETFKAVHESNMTKACKTEQEAIETIEFLRETQPRYDPAYREFKNYYIVYDKNTGKALKSKYYKEVDLTFIKKN
jgi:predicted HAD superfamily Cof-like phosphohydrolase